MYVNFLWLVIGTVIFINMGLALLATLGLAWAPVGAVIYARDGKRKGESPIRYAVVGVVSSLLFFIPWFFVRKWIGRQTLPGDSVVLVYAFLYLAWMLGPIPLWIAVASEYGLMIRLVPGSMLAAWALTLLILIRTQRIRARKRSGVSSVRSSQLPYFLPLLGLYVCYAPFIMVFSQGWIDNLR